MSTFYSHKGGKNDSSVYLDFDRLRDASPISYIPVESAKNWTCFCKSGVHFIIDDDRLREGAAEVGEVFYHLQSLSPDGDVGLDVWFFRRWLVDHFCLFCANG